MIPIFYIAEAGAKGLLPLSPAPQIPANPGPPLRSGQILLDHPEHLLHNHCASVASLRLLFTFAPECRSPSLRNHVRLHRNTQLRLVLTYSREGEPLTAERIPTLRYSLGTACLMMNNLLVSAEEERQIKEGGQRC